MSSRTARCFQVKTDWICTKTSPRGHPNPRPDPPALVLPEWGACAHALLSWAAYHWPHDRALRDWYAASAQLEREPEAAQRAHWEALAAQFHAWFAEDYAAAAAGADSVFHSPRELYEPACLRREEEKLQAQLGGNLLRKYRAGWKEERREARRAKARFFEQAGIEAKWRDEGTSEQQRSDAWGHVQRLVALARSLFPPQHRLQAEFPALWDTAERDARAAIPRDATVTTQSAAWRAAVLASAQERYAVYVRKARDPARPDGHRLYFLPEEQRRSAGGGSGTW